ncbi:YsnF/AvaK domain-containing protein [Fibrella aquatica]|uniref:YsnF/AvaK domain-containing protein n=1 Tax=Fibrella aquatica TaxID=3242487 RepID=UPI003521AA91
MFPNTPNSTSLALPLEQDSNLYIASSEIVIPIIDEQLQVHTEWVETGRVRVSKQVHEETQTIDVPVTHEVVDVERVAINRVIDEVPLSRQEGDTLILPVVREEVVTSIRLVLVEEVRITRRQEQAVDQQTITIRHETISVNRSDPEGGLTDNVPN